MAHRPFKLVHCTWATGIGNGVSRMDAFFHRFLDRSIVEPTIVYLDEGYAAGADYDKDLRVEETGSENRFEALLNFFRDADIVQFQGGFDALVCEAARAAKVPVLIEIVHNIEQGGAFSNIDMTVCVSEAVRAAQAEDARSTTIHNGIDVDPFPFQPKTVTERIVLLQVASREKVAWNLDQLAPEIFALDPNIELWIAGRGQEGHSEGNVKFLGVAEDISLLYPQADALVVLSTAEPFGLVALEALSSGCVTILSNTGAFPEIVRHGQHGFLVPISSKEAAIEGVRAALALRRSETWTKIQHDARALVDAYFTAQACMERYEDLYQMLMREKGRRQVPGPSSAPITPEVELGEAILHSHKGRWDAVDQALARLVELEKPFTNQQSKAVARIFVPFLEARKREETLNKFFDLVRE